MLGLLLLCGCNGKKLMNGNVYSNNDNNEIVGKEVEKESDFSDEILGSKDEEIRNTGNINKILKWDWVVEPGLYEDMFFISDNLIALKDNKNKYKVINVMGEDVFHDVYDNISEFSDNIALVKSDGKVSYINENGTPISEITYQNGHSFNESFAAVERDNKWGFIQLDGKLAIPFQYDEVKSFSENLAAIKMKNKWGFIDVYGTTVINPNFEAVKDFKEGIAALKLNGKWGFINNENEKITDFIFNDVKNFNEGYAAVKKEGKWGFINSSGNVAIDFKYDDVGSFSEGKASVKRKQYIEGTDAWAYIDENEIIIIDYYPYDAADGRMIFVGAFKDDYVFVSKTLYTIIDSAGNDVFNENSDFFISVLDYDKEYDVIPGYVFIDENMRHKKYGLVGINGEGRIEPVFDYIYGVKNSYVVIDNIIDGVPKKGIIKLYKE